MTSKTRYFVITSLLVLVVGLGTGLVAYYVDTPVAAQATQAADELRFVPANAALVAYASVSDIMASPLRQQLRAFLPMPADGQQQFQQLTGINIDTDIDRIVTAMVPESSSGGPLMVARGRFDEVKIEALMREHGATVEEYAGQRLLIGKDGRQRMAVSFLAPGLVALGSEALVRSAVDLKRGGANVLTNTELMTRVRNTEAGNVWAVGRVEGLGIGPGVGNAGAAGLASQVGQVLPGLKWITASAQIDSGARGQLRAETQDEATASGLRDMIGGLLAFARLQASSRPELQSLVQSVSLANTGNSVVISFDITSQAFEGIGSLLQMNHGRAPAAR